MRRLRDEHPKPLVDIDVINHDRAAWPHMRPGPSQLKQYVLRRMQAVVDEQVNRPGGVQQSWQLSAARSPDQCPIRPKSVRHSNADFLVEFRLQQRRHVDTPQTAAVIALQGLQHKSRG